MTSSITSNVAAYGAQSNIGAASTRASASISRLSSGSAINRASDDVAGLATGTSLRTQVTSLRTALANTTQGTSLLQVADGSLSQIVDILQRQKAIAVQAGSGSLTDTNRQLLNQEFQALTNEVNRIASTTSFNGVSLLSGGLGITPILAGTDAQAAAATYYDSQFSDDIISSSTAIQAFDTLSGISRQGTSAGQLQFTDSSGNILQDNAYQAVNQSVYGTFSKFEFNDVSYGASGIGAGTLTATLNGVNYRGSVVSNSINAIAILSNGSTSISMGLGAVSFDNAGTTQNSLANITNIFSTVSINRTNIIEGVDFEGTALDGLTFNKTLRIASNGNAVIKDFRYVGGGVVNQNRLAVTINDKTFVARVKDSFLFFTVGGTDLPIINFKNGSETLQINFGEINFTRNIRTDLEARRVFIDALNIGFARAGSGLDFNVGSNKSDSINIMYGSAATVSIYDGQSLGVASATSAANASIVLDTAINQVISLRASVGALQSRFNFAGESIQSSIESQDAARGSLLDTDVAKESTKFAAAQVQLQAGIAVLAQANQLPGNLLNLLNLNALGGA